MKTMTRIRKTMLILFAALTMMLVTAGTSQAATLTTKQKAYKSYATFLAKEGYLSKIDRQYRKMVKFTVGYYNNDNVPDLLVMYYSGPRGYANALLYTYKNGKVTQFGKCSGDVCGYYRKANVFHSSSRYDGEGNLTDSYYTPTLSGSSRAGDLYRTKRYGRSTVYSKSLGGYRTQSISGKTFSSLLKKKVGGATYKKINAVSNNKSNRKKILGF